MCPPHFLDVLGLALLGHGMVQGGDEFGLLDLGLFDVVMSVKPGRHLGPAPHGGLAHMGQGLRKVLSARGTGPQTHGLSCHVRAPCDLGAGHQIIRADATHHDPHRRTVDILECAGDRLSKRGAFPVEVELERGVLDLIGAARPSIADPFLPNKIANGEEDDIRECIGCNICRATFKACTPIRCTQNPTMGEEWRRGWHPERVAVMPEAATVLVVGAGPAGLEAAATLAKRGSSVLLAEATTQLGGRVNHECQLPGLSEWRRVRDYRVQFLSRHSKVSIHLDSHMNAQDVIDTECDHVLLATGSSWRRDGTGRSTASKISGLNTTQVLTPDDIMSGRRSNGRYLIYDDDGYYIASAIAVLLCEEGNEVVYVTPDNAVSAWSTLTTEQHLVQSQLISLNVQIITAHYLTSIDANQARLSCVYSDRIRIESQDCVIPVTSREPNDDLWRNLGVGLPNGGTIMRIGDCRAPGIIATAVFDGHRTAREIDRQPQAPSARREMIALFDQ